MSFSMLTNFQYLTTNLKKLCLRETKMHQKLRWRWESRRACASHIQSCQIKCHTNICYLGKSLHTVILFCHYEKHPEVMLMTKLPATPAAPEPWGSSGSRRAPPVPPLGSTNTPSNYHPHPRAGAGVPPGHPRDAHQDFPLLKHVWTSRVMGTSPSQHCHAAAQLDCAPCSSVGFDKKPQPDPGEGVLEWRHIMQTHMLAMNMPMSTHSHGAKILMTRADTSFLSKEFFHAITEMMVQEKQLFLAWGSFLQQK